LYQINLNQYSEKQLILNQKNTKKQPPKPQNPLFCPDNSQYCKQGLFGFRDAISIIILKIYLIE
jgi:hypothetical protein